jgi:hypothetical protein
MKTFIAIIGNRNAGKSSVIKSLTGCPNNSFRGFVEDNRSGASIYVSCGSPQEQPVGLEDLADLRATLQEVMFLEGCRGAVMAIQPSVPNTRLSMEAVLAEAMRQNFAVHAYVLDPERNGATGAQASVSVRLKGMGLVALPLDTRRFAHINATIIDTATGIAA